MSPIHAAAHLGDIQLVRSLLQLKADGEKKTSLCRSALQIAEEANVAESHEDVIALLKPQVKCFTVHELLRTLG